MFQKSKKKQIRTSNMLSELLYLNHYEIFLLQKKNMLNYSMY